LNLQPFFLRIFWFCVDKFLKITFKNNILNSLIKVSDVFEESKLRARVCFSAAGQTFLGRFRNPMAKANGQSERTHEIRETSVVETPVIPLIFA